MASVHDKTKARHRREAKLVQDVVDAGRFIDVGDNDIRPGRGNASSNSAANERYREIVNYGKHLQYVQASPSGKKGIQESLYKEITEENGLRFAHKVKLVMSGGDNPHWILHDGKTESTSIVVEKFIPQPKLLALKKIANRLNDVRDGEVATAPHAASPPAQGAHDGDDDDTPMAELNVKLPESPSSTLVQPFQYVQPSSQQTQTTARYLPAVVSPTQPAAVTPNPSSPPSQQAGILNQGHPHQGGSNGVLTLSLLPIAGQGKGPATPSTTPAGVPIARQNAVQPSPSSLLLPMLLASLNEDGHQQHRTGVASLFGGNTSEHLLNQLSGSVVNHIAEKFGTITNTNS